ncbi:MAG: N-acetylmuramoyl-L-alanine amidase [Campylobacterota bacterium]|nr:N-acetylmuramoyl-L-alanine amidase [Campylobacterota bacterium]
MSNNKAKEIEYLKKLIRFGDKLNIDTIKYKKELNKLDKTIISNNKIRVKSIIKSKYSIKSVKQSKTEITIIFYKNINKSYIDFYERKTSKYHRDYFDIKGSYKNAKIKKLRFKDIDRTTIYQHKKNILRIYLQDKYNPKTTYSINKNILKINVGKKKKKSINKVKMLKNNVNQKSINTQFLKTKKYNISKVEQLGNSIVINFTHKINKSYLKFYEKKINGKNRDYFDISGRYKGAKSKKIKLESIEKTVVYQHKKDILRIYLQNKKSPNTIYIFNNNKIIIKVLDKNKAVLGNNLLNNSIYNKKIVIDAGHGGKDSGAVGKNKNYEKTVVLNISKYLKKELEKKGFKVYLTRSRDKYIKLLNRTKYANKKNADMFISIHANAARKSRAKKAHGVETYFLSPARSARAKRVAALENKGDMKKMGWSSKNSLLTILNQGKITASNKMAIDIQKNMLYTLRKRYGDKTIRDGGVREGPFWVLVGAQMPSVLIEIGYISHPKEGRRIATREYQKRTAIGIANGIESYFIKN